MHFVNVKFTFLYFSFIIKINHICQFSFTEFPKNPILFRYVFQKALSLKLVVLESTDVNISIFKDFFAKLVHVIVFERTFFKKLELKRIFILVNFRVESTMSPSD